MLQPAEIARIEDFVVEFHDIFARHRFDIGMNEDFKVKLTPKDDSPAYSQSLSTPINLKEDILVELALLYSYGTITTLPLSKYASPIFARKKPNRKLRLLVNFRKINNLISDDYINNNHPVSTLTAAAQHMVGRKLFCKLDCSQAYHCSQMADQRSIELLAFNFASRTFAYRRLRKDLVEPYRPFLVLCANIWTKSLKQTNVHKMLMILALLPTMPNNLSTTSGRHFSTFNKLVSNLQGIIAYLVQRKSIFWDIPSTLLG